MTGPPAGPVRLLLIEDSEDDAQSILRALRRAGFEPSWRRVETLEETRAALQEDDWDAVIADYSLPLGFSGLDALALVKQRGVDVPFILASGMIGEDVAVQAMRAGAHDYVMKRSLKRLPFALARELREAEDRRERRRAEQELQRQAHFTAALTNSLGEGVFAATPAGKVTFINAAAERILGWSAADVIGREVHEILHPHRARTGVEEPCGVTRILRSELALDAGEDLFRRKDGSLLPVSFTASSLVREGGGEGAVVVFVDIRERKRAERATRFLAGAAAALGESLELGPTLERIVSLCVPELVDFCSVDVESVLDGSYHQTWRSVVAMERADQRRSWRPPRPGEPLVPGPWKTIRSGAPELLPQAPPELLGCSSWSPAQRHALERLWPVSFLSVPLATEGRILGALSLASRRGAASPELDLSLVQAFAERAALAIQHARLFLMAQDAVRTRDDFLSIASHELKTPLTTLDLQLQVLQKARQQGGIPSADELAGGMQGARRQVEKLAGLVSNLLDVSRLEAGRLELEREELELSSMVREVAERAAMELDRAGSRLSLQLEPVTGRWDRLRIEQVITNLLGNAIKYGAGQPIEISVQQAGRVARLQIRDHGIGIAPEQLGRIFERFERAVPDRSYGGMGLGLYIVRQYVEAHGGTVRVESRLHAGSNFTVELPLGPPEEGAHQAAEGHT